MQSPVEEASEGTWPLFPVPEPDRVVREEMADGAEIFLRHYAAPKSSRADVRLVLSHGNGMASDLYAPYWSQFLGHYDLVLYDFRNHGWNAVQKDHNHGFPFFVWDNQRVYQAIQHHFGARVCIGLFHSMAAITAILQTLALGKTWDGLVLFDPPLTPPNGHPLERQALDNHFMMADRARRRPEFYAGGFDAFLPRIAKAPQFQNLVPGGLALFARSTFREQADGIRLRCPKELEAYVFSTNLDSTIYPRMSGFPVPILFLGGDPERADAEAPSHSCQALAHEWAIPHCAIENTSHFLQIEAPASVADETFAFLKHHGWS